MSQQRPLATLSDDELLRRVAELVQQSRRVEADLVAHLAEVDERRLHAHQAFPSLFAYCTEALHLSEAEAYLRIAVARASWEHPILLAMLGDGRLHLTGIAKLAPHLTRENRDTLLKRATHRTKRQIEELVAEIAPKPDAPAVMRKLPERNLPEGRTLPTPALLLCPDRDAMPVGQLRPDAVAPPSPGPIPPTNVPSLPPTAIQPLAPGRYKVQFTASAELQGKLERLKALMRSQVPDGDLAAIIEQAVTEKLERLEARRFATTKAPRKDLSETDAYPSSRHIPAAIRRVVRERDGDRCRYVDHQGRRCSERGRLEYHHRYPFGLGGDHRLENVCLMCGAHNAYLAEHDYGWDAMVRHRGSRSKTPKPARSLTRSPSLAMPPGVQAFSGDSSAVTQPDLLLAEVKTSPQ